MRVPAVLPIASHHQTHQLIFCTLGILTYRAALLRATFRKHQSRRQHRLVDRFEGIAAARQHHALQLLNARSGPHDTRAAEVTL
jgi:hypothetical protein